MGLFNKQPAKKKKKTNQIKKTFTHHVEDFFGGISNTIQISFPFLFNFVNYDGYRIVKMILYLPIGLVTAYLLWNLWMKDLPMPQLVINIMGGVSMGVLVIGWMFSPMVRCWCFLLIPTMSGKSGRTFIFTIAITLMLKGPVENVIHNVQTISGGVACNTKFAFDMVKQELALYASPLVTMKNKLVNQASKALPRMKSTLDSFENILGQVRDTLNSKEGEDDEAMSKYNLTSSNEGNLEQIHNKKEYKRCRGEFSSDHVMQSFSVHRCF